MPGRLQGRAAHIFRRVSLGHCRRRRPQSRVSHPHRLDCQGFYCRDEVRQPPASRAGDATKEMGAEDQPVGVTGIPILMRLGRKSRQESPLLTRLALKSRQRNLSASRRKPAARGKAHCRGSHTFRRITNTPGRVRKAHSRVTKLLSRITKSVVASAIRIVASQILLVAAAESIVASPNSRVTSRDLSVTR
jgi:hypothetical protein